MWLDNDMTATEIHNFLLTHPNTAAMRRFLQAEGVNFGSLTKPGLEGLILDLYIQRRGY
jgi:hypothetical protein